MKVLHLPSPFDSISDVMIRGDYDEAVRDIERHHTSETPPKNVIIAGHPGMGRTMGSIGQAWVLIYTPPYLGKTTLLYYILVKRLLEPSFRPVLTSSFPSMPTVFKFYTHPRLWSPGRRHIRTRGR